MSRQTAQQISMFSLDDLIDEAVEYIRANESEEGFAVMDSGGKDSDVIVKLAEIAGVKHQCFYECTRIDPRESMSHLRINRPNTIWLYPAETLWNAIQRKGPPLKTARWCCDVLKKDTAKHLPYRHRILGMRAEESTKRAKRPRTDPWKKGQVEFKPIFQWTEYHIWAFHEKYNLPYSKLYDEGFGRSGCIPCPFVMGSGPGNTAKRNMSMKYYPQIWNVFRHACERWFESKDFTILRTGQHHTTFSDFWPAYLRGFEGDKDKDLLERFYPDQLLLMDEFEEAV